MRKTLLCLFAAVICIMNLTVAVSAEEFNGSNSWNVEFDGNKMKSNFKSSEMTEEIYQLLPGDIIHLQVEIQNSGSNAANWYMTNEVDRKSVV